MVGYARKKKLPATILKMLELGDVSLVLKKPVAAKRKRRRKREHSLKLSGLGHDVMT